MAHASTTNNMQLQTFQPPVPIFSTLPMAQEPALTSPEPASTRKLASATIQEPVAVTIPVVENIPVAEKHEILSYEESVKMVLQPNDLNDLLNDVTTSGQNEFNTILNDVQKKDHYIKTLQNDCKDWQAKYQELQLKYQELQQKYDSTEATYQQTIKELTTELENRHKTHQKTIDGLNDDIKKHQDIMAEKDDEIRSLNTELSKSVHSSKSADDSNNDSSDHSSQASTSRKRKRTNSGGKIDTVLLLKRQVQGLKIQLRRAGITPDAEPSEQCQSCDKQKQFITQLTQNYNKARDCVIHYKKKTEQLQADLKNVDTLWTAMVTRMNKVCNCKLIPVVRKEH